MWIVVAAFSDLGEAIYAEAEVMNCKWKDCFPELKKAVLVINT